MDGNQTARQVTRKKIESLLFHLRGLNRQIVSLFIVNRLSVITSTEVEISKKELLTTCGELILMICRLCYKTHHTLCSGSWYSKKETVHKRFLIIRLLCIKIRQSWSEACKETLAIPISIHLILPQALGAFCQM